jgi:hypothetical protein
MIIIGIIFLVLLAALGWITWGTVLSGWSGDDIVVEETSSPGPTPSASPSPSCADDLAGFQGYANSRPDVQANVVTSVSTVCWESTGELRVEAAYTADVNPTSAPMTWLCTTLSGFIDGSGRTWQGFTVYSTRAPTQGRAMLTGRTAGGPCVNPRQPPR